MSGGLKFVGTDSQGDVTGKQKLFNIDSGLNEVITQGDLVVYSGTSEIFSSKGGRAIANVKLGPAATASIGVAMSVAPNFAGEALSKAYHVAQTAGQVLVNTDPNANYRVDTSATMAIGDVGQNCEAVVTASTPVGNISTSIMTANQATLAATATLPLHIVALEEDADGVFGNVAIVRLNSTTVAPGATGL